jgi:hypothetical protein
VPNTDATIFGPGNDDRELGVEADDGHVVRMALQCLHAGLVLVVPHFNKPRNEDK